MHAWHAMSLCKWNKIKTNSNKRIIVKFSLRPLHPARPRECVWARCFCGWVREFDQNLLWQVLVRDSGLHSRHISNPNLCTFMRSYSKWRWNLRLGNKRCSGHRKFFISSLELVFICSLNDKQEFIYPRSSPTPRADSPAYAPHTDSTPVEKAAGNHSVKTAHPASQ